MELENILNELIGSACCAVCGNIGNCFADTETAINKIKALDSQGSVT